MSISEFEKSSTKLHATEKNKQIERKDEEIQDLLNNLVRKLEN